MATKVVASVPVLVVGVVSGLSVIIIVGHSA